MRPTLCSLVLCSLLVAILTPLSLSLSSKVCIEQDFDGTLIQIVGTGKLIRVDKSEKELCRLFVKTILDDADQQRFRDWVWGDLDKPDRNLINLVESNRICSSQLSDIERQLIRYIPGLQLSVESKGVCVLMPGREITVNIIQSWLRLVHQS